MEKIKILVVEDHKVSQKLLDHALQDEVYDKRFADNGQAALDNYREWKPDIILLDLLLPVVSGYSMLKEIRIKEKDTSTAIIVISSLMSKEDIMDCVKLGIQGYIVKPINVKEIGRKVLEHFIKAYPARATEAVELFKLVKSKQEAAGQAGSSEADPPESSSSEPG